MKEIISKELLSAILKRDVTYVDKHIPTKEIHCNIGNSDLYYEVCRYGTWNSINVYELMAKAKEWAFKNYSSRYVICSQNDITQGIAYFPNVKSNELSNNMSLNKNGTEFSFQDKLNFKMAFVGETEYHAVFNACQWAYDNKKKGHNND